MDGIQVHLHLQSEECKLRPRIDCEAQHVSGHQKADRHTFVHGTDTAASIQARSAFSLNRPHQTATKHNMAKTKA